MEPKFYSTYVTKDKNGQEMLYVKLQKALYGLLRVVYLFCRKLIMDLGKYGFILILLYSCVMSNIIESCQATVTWHVNGLKVSHKYLLRLLSLINIYIRFMGKRTVQQGLIQVYMGMVINVSMKESVEICMVLYLVKIIHTFLEEIKFTAAAPKAYHLVHIRYLSKETLLPE